MRRLVVFVRNAAPYNKASKCMYVCMSVIPPVVLYDVEQGDG